MHAGTRINECSILHAFIYVQLYWIICMVVMHVQFSTYLFSTNLDQYNTSIIIYNIRWFIGGLHRLFLLRLLSNRVNLLNYLYQSCYEILWLGIFITEQLLHHIVQKEKIAPKIAAKITGVNVNGPLINNERLHFYVVICSMISVMLIAPFRWRIKLLLNSYCS
jgi:hypothetical protein